MIRVLKRLPTVLLAGVLAACASAPMHYYTLVAPAQDGDAAVVEQGAATVPFQLMAVGIPAQVDQPQLVVREGAQSVAVLNDRRWIAPLGDEFRSALSADLARDLHSQDIGTLPGDEDRPLLRIKLDVQRFDSQPGGYALIQGVWSVHLVQAPTDGMLACTSRISESVGSGYDALVQGHQRAIAALASRIAAVARTLAAGQSATCPAD